MIKNKFLVILIAVMLFSATVFVCSGKDITSSTSGPDLLRANDTLTIKYSVDNVKCYGFQGNISYNNEIMTLVSAKALKEHWVIELMGNGRFIAYSKIPLDESTEFNGGEIFAFDFKISENAPTGEYATMKFRDVVATDSVGEFDVVRGEIYEI